MFYVEIPMVLIVLKDLKNQKWIIYELTENNALNLIGVEDFGMITLHFLNLINRYCNKNNERYNVSELVEMRVEYTEQDKKMWLNHYDELYNFILSLDKHNVSEKSAFLKKYRFLGFASIRNIPLEKIYQIHQYEYIRRNKKVILTNGQALDSYTVMGFDYLFIMDLEELLYNPQLKIKIRKCQLCNDFFELGNRNTKKCLYCRDSSVSRRNYYRKRKADANLALWDKIYNTLNKRGFSEENSFVTESHYYEACINGEEVLPNPEYRNNIKTEDDYYQWLVETHNKILKKGGQNGKANKKGKRNGSNN